MMTVSEWVDHWSQQATLIPPDELRELLEKLTEDEGDEQ